MAMQIFEDYQVSATVTSNRRELAIRNPGWQAWLWKVTTTGTGVNVVTISPTLLGNWEESDVDVQEFPLSAKNLWRGPKVITTGMIDAAPSTTYLKSYLQTAHFDRMKFTFTYSGAGSRVFIFNVWVQGAR